MAPTRTNVAHHSPKKVVMASVWPMACQRLSVTAQRPMKATRRMMMQGAIMVLDWLGLGTWDAGNEVVLTHPSHDGRGVKDIILG